MLIFISHFDVYFILVAFILKKHLSPDLPRKGADTEPQWGTIESPVRTSFAEGKKLPY